jgi:hypothetical protein
MSITRANGSKPKSGYRVGSSRAVAPYASRAAKHPAKVDLRPMLTEVEDQQTTSSCASNAVAGAYEYLIKAHLGGAAYDVSRLFLYFNARQAQGFEGEDGGSTIEAGIESLRTRGACSEQTWPFEPSQVNTEPSEDAYVEGAQFPIQDAASVPTELDAWKGALADGYPIIFALKLYDSFDRQRKPGLVPAPSPNEAGRESHGGHAMLCVGYSEKDRVFIVRNSWGTGWGDKGYCYIPFGYMMNPELNFGDSWIIKRLDAVPEPDASGDDTGVLPSAENLLSGMNDDAWVTLSDALGDIALESRIAMVFLAAASTDDAFTDEECAILVPYLDRLLPSIGSTFSAEDVISFAWSLLGQHPELSDESIEILGAHLPTEALAAIANEIANVVEADGASDGESAFHVDLVTQWQLLAD